MKFGIDKWDLIGNEVRMTHTQVTSATPNRPSDAGKLQTIRKMNWLRTTGNQAVARGMWYHLGLVKQHLDTHPTGRYV